MHFWQWMSKVSWIYVSTNTSVLLSEETGGSWTRDCGDELKYNHIVEPGTK
jgi:hypothetical protein